LAGKRITLYGNGKQIRDVLFIDDLMTLYDSALSRIGKVRGEVFNVGGGVGQTLSLLELIDWIQGRLKIPLRLGRGGWRPGDQKAYISGISKARRLLAWAPDTSVRAGLEKLLAWAEPRVPADRSRSWS